MKDNIKKIVKGIISCVCIVGLLFSVVYIGYTYNMGLKSQKELAREIRINYTINRHEFNEVYKLLYYIVKNQRNSQAEQEIMKRVQVAIVDGVNKLSEISNQTDKLLAKKIKEYSPLSIADVERIKKANIIIKNHTVGALGSGTIIKIKNKYYILTCAHLVKGYKDIIYGVFDDGSDFPIQLIDFNRRKDLALFRLHKATVSAYLEVSDVEPKDGEALVIIGNPSGIEDVITRGNLCRRSKRFYMFSNLIFFGNSGGCVLYNNKIVGVVSALQTMRGNGLDVHYGWCSGLVNIRRFLEDCGVV